MAVLTRLVLVAVLVTSGSAQKIQLSIIPNTLTLRCDTASDVYVSSITITKPPSTKSLAFVDSYYGARVDTSIQQRATATGSVFPAARSHLVLTFNDTITSSDAGNYLCQYNFGSFRGTAQANITVNTTQDTSGLSTDKRQDNKGISTGERQDNRSLSTGDRQDSKGLSTGDRQDSSGLSTDDRQGDRQDYRGLSTGAAVAISVILTFLLTLAATLAVVFLLLRHRLMPGPTTNNGATQDRDYSGLDLSTREPPEVKVYNHVGPYEN